ncbi:hypothetical protein HK098_006187 [Nowakowskiella sp. JEL0407]|nr:hypothetical protein HK098_006187 [Nowakowskiella sp. JEL0407]
MSLYFVAFIVWDSFGFFTLFKKQAGPVNKFTLGQTIFLGFETFGQLFMMLDFYRSLSYEKEIINTDKNDLTVWTPAIIGWHVMVGVNTIVSILFLSILWKLTRKLQREEYLDKQQTADGEDYIKQFETVVIEGDGDTKDVKDVKDIEKPEMAKEKMTIQVMENT